MEIQWLLMCFVFLSLYRSYHSHEIKNTEELETRFKRNQASTNAGNILLNNKLSPEQLKIELGKQIKQNNNVVKKRKLDRAGVSSNKLPDLISHATKQPINTRNGISSTNRRSKKLPRTVKNIPNDPKTGVDANFTAIPQEIDLTLNDSRDTKNSTHNPANDTKKDGTKKKYKLKTIYVEDDDDIEHSKNIEEKHRVLSSKSESNVFEIMLDDTHDSKMPNDNKPTNKTATENLKSNNYEVATVEILKNKPTSVVNDGKIPNNHTKTEKIVNISFTNKKDNLSSKSTNKYKDLESSNNKKSMSSNVPNYEPFNEYDYSESNKSNAINVPNNGNEKPKTVPAETSDNHVVKNDFVPIKISETDANKTSEFNNTEQIGTILKRNLKGSLDDEEIGHADEIIRIDQPFKILVNEDNIKNETSISISMLPNRSITIEKTDLEEIHETYHSNIYQNQPPEQENTQNSWYKSNQNYGQECQYPYQYGSYQTIPYSNNAYNPQFKYQYGQPYYGFENYNQDMEENGIVENSIKEPLYFDTLAQYSQSNKNIIFDDNFFIEKGIHEIIDKDPAINIESPDVQPRNRVSDPIYNNQKPSRNNILGNPLVVNGNIGMSMKDPVTVDLPNVPLFGNLGKNTCKGLTYPNVQAPYMRMYGNLENGKNVFEDIPQKENSFQKPNCFYMEPRKNFDILPLSKTQQQNIGKDPFREIQIIDSDPVYSKVETPYNSFEQNPGYKDKLWRKWKNSRILINNLNKPITIEMEGLNRLKTPSCYKKPISDGTVGKKLKTNKVNQKQPMKQYTY